MKYWVSWREPKSRETAVGAPQPRAETHASSALKALFHTLRGDRRYCVLDLGAASGPNVDFLSRFASKIHIAELFTTLQREGVPQDESLAEPPVAHLLPFPEETRFDLIFAWNLLDYLEREWSVALIRHLDRFCRSGTFLVALSTTLREMPELPVRFHFVDPETLAYELPSPRLRAAPRHTPRDFISMMAGFRVHSSFLLKNGFQEYLFVHE